MNKASTLLSNTGAVFPIQSLSVRHRCSHGGATRGPRVLTEILSVVTESASPARLGDGARVARRSYWRKLGKGYTGCVSEELSTECESTITLQYEV